MTKILVISRLVGICKEPALPAQIAKLQELADSEVGMEFVYAGDTDAIRQMLHSNWDVIWARGVTDELREEISRHPATKLVAVTKKVEQQRQGRNDEEFDTFAVLGPQGLRPLTAGELTTSELV